MTPRRQRIDLGKQVEAQRVGAAMRFDDLYHAVLSASWPAFAGIVCAVFLAVNVVFGALYASAPGSVANSHGGSLIDDVFFSIETLGTVGYGDMHPASLAGNVISSLEILTGLFFSATVTGLIFARFSLPKTGVAFGRAAVVGRHDGRPALMVRVVSTRSRPLIDADAQMSWLQTVVSAEGSSARRLVPLELVSSRNPMLGLSWILTHVTFEGSELLDALAGDGRFYVSVFVRGTDLLSAGQRIGTRVYGRNEILVDREFTDMLGGEGEHAVLDMRKLDETRPLDAGGAAER